MKLNENQKLFSDIIISLLEQMYDMHNGTLSELCDPVRNANKELIINELSKIMFKYNIEDTCLNIGKVQQMKLYKELCSKINEMFDNEYRAEKDCISDILSQTTKDSYYINSFVTGLGISYTLKPVSNKTLQEIINHKIDGKMWSERLWDDKVNLRKDLKLQVKKFFNGEINVNNISDVIEKKYRNNRYVTNRLVNNEISIIQEDVNDVWREEHNIKWVIYMGTLDKHICSNCAQYDGKSYEVGKEPVELPQGQHVGCRCTYVNIPSSDWKPRERLDNETKEKINWQSYEEWHKNYIENNPKRLANEKMIKNKSSDRKQYEKYKEILGKEVPKSFDKFQELKYNNSTKWELFKDYTKSRSSNMISVFTSFDDYKKYKTIINEEIVGLKTANGIEIKSQSKHFIERVLGTSFDTEKKKPRDGIEANDILKTLTNPLKIKEEFKKNSHKFIGEKITITVNPNTGNLIQCNPTDSDLVRRLKNV